MTTFPSLPQLLLSSLWIAGSLALQAQAQTLIDFESLPVPSTGFFNGDTDGEDQYRDRFRITGTRDNFGQPETLQLWELGGVEFFNGFTPAYQSWNGFSWSQVQDTTTPGFENQYAAFPGSGSLNADGTGDSLIYAVSYSSSFFNLESNSRILSMDVANTTYAALSMLGGDGFGIEFGGETGDEPDFFGVTLTAYDQHNARGTALASLDHFLADYRSSDPEADIVQSDWQTLDLSAFEGARSVGIEFFSSDVGPFGINTPTYIAIDNLRLDVSAVPEPAIGFPLAIGWLLASCRRRRS